jgi:thioredoxin-related protein
MLFAVNAGRFARMFAFAFFMAAVGAVLAVAEPEMDDGSDEAVPKHLQIMLTNDLAALGELAQQKHLPILIMYSAEDCGYCKRLEAEVLGPMGLDATTASRVIVRKLMMDEYESLHDFHGDEQNAETYAILQGVQVTPTLALLDSSGKTLVPMIIGYQSADMYSSYLDQAIDVSRQILAARDN